MVRLLWESNSPRSRHERAHRARPPGRRPVLPGVPGRFGSIEGARAFCAACFDRFNHAHRHGIGPLRAAGEICERRTATLDPPTPPPTRPVPPPTSDATEAVHRRLDQQASHRRHSSIRMRSRSRGLDGFRDAIRSRRDIRPTSSSPSRSACARAPTTSKCPSSFV